VDPARVFYRDNKSYFNVLLDDNIRKWICILGFNGVNKYIQLNDGKKMNIKIASVNDILDYKAEILAVAGQFESVRSM
jgi:predicted type IV restriction endonuclease